MKKTTLSLLCAAVIATGLTGCNQNQNDQTQADMYRGSDQRFGQGQDFSSNQPYSGGVRGKEYYQDNRFSQKNDRLNNGQGTGNRQNMINGRGITGNNRPGMVDENGIVNRKADRDHQRGMQFNKMNKGNQHTR